jgi:hypothetical protein
MTQRKGCLVLWIRSTNHASPQHGRHNNKSSNEGTTDYRQLSCRSLRRDGRERVRKPRRRRHFGRHHPLKFALHRIVQHSSLAMCRSLDGVLCNAALGWAIGRLDGMSDTSPLVMSLL